MDANQLRESIDACRPCGRDLDLPEMASLAAEVAHDGEIRRMLEQSQQLDLRIRSALDDVSLPDGLRERLLARVSAAAASPGAAELPPVDQGKLVSASSDQLLDRVASQATAASAPALQATADRKPAGNLIPGRRPWLLAAGLVGTALVLTLAFVFRPQPEGPLTGEQLLVLAEHWAENDLKDGAWDGDLDRSPWETYPPDHSVNASVLGWRTLKTPLDPQAAVYQLDVAGEFGATLTVLRPKRELTGIALAPTRLPASSTGNRSIGVWRRDKLVYVLIVNGPPAQYQQLVRPTNIARHDSSLLLNFAG